MSTATYRELSFGGGSFVSASRLTRPGAPLDAAESGAETAIWTRREDSALEPEDPEPTATHAVVWGFVRQLADDLGADSIIELLDDFTQQTPLRLAELERIAGRAEWQPVLQRGAHSLKGSSSIFGLTDLEHAAHRLEKSAGHDLAEQTHQVQELEHEFQRVRPILEAIKSKLQTH